MDESVLMDAFVTGLVPSRQAEVMSRYPQNLETCMKEAQLVNDRNLALKLAVVELSNQGLGNVVVELSNQGLGNAVVELSDEGLGNAANRSSKRENK